MMFTGLVTGIGTVEAISPQGADMRLKFSTPLPIESIARGDSVAVNGVCLTAEKHVVIGKTAGFSAYVSGETLKNSNLGDLKGGSPVNLELALTLGSRLGGHIVSGHMDGLARVDSVEQRSDSRLVKFSCARDLDMFIVTKGSVCVDGISLTVTACAPGRFELNIIPETWNVTIARYWRPGYAANLEVDILGKYVAKMLRLAAPGRAGARENGNPLDMDFFAEKGFN